MSFQSGPEPPLSRARPRKPARGTNVNSLLREFEGRNGAAAQRIEDPTLGAVSSVCSVASLTRVPH